MIGRLWQYFGFVGTASVVLQLAAVALPPVLWRHRWRTRGCLLAVSAAVLALILAGVNSSRISDIEVDRSAEQAARVAQQREEAMREMRKHAAEVRYAEDTQMDRLDLAGVKPEEKTALAGGVEPEYRRRGKQVREGQAGTPLVTDVQVAPEERSGRRMAEADVLRANRYDRVNLLLVHLVLLGAVAVGGWDYLSRFHKVVGDLAPLPISGSVVDSLFRKSHTVCLAGPREAMRRCLERAVQKGGAFIYFAPDDPWEQASSLPRLPKPLAQFRRLPKIAFDLANPPFENDFVFESAWFGRYCFVLSSGVAQGMLTDLVRYLSVRQGTGARARRLVTVAWDLPEMPDAGTLNALRFLCRETNWRLILRADAEPADTAGFDEVVRA